MNNKDIFRNVILFYIKQNRRELQIYDDLAKHGIYVDDDGGYNKYRPIFYIENVIDEMCKDDTLDWVYDQLMSLVNNIEDDEDVDKSVDDFIELCINEGIVNFKS